MDRPLPRAMAVTALCASLLWNPSAGSASDVRYWPRPEGAGGPEAAAPRSAPLPRRNPRLLVLAYHNLVYGRTGSVYNRDIYNFEHDLAFLERNFAVIGFDEALELSESIRRDPDLPAPDAAVITFDDGDLSMYALAFPLLREYGLPATFFIVPELVGTVGYMSWDQIRAMAGYRDEEGRALFSFGSHSLSHARLGELGPAERRRELAESKREIEAAIGVRITALALPFGSGAGDAGLLGIAKELGYRVVRTSSPKADPVGALDPFDIGALAVENYPSDALVKKALALARP